MGNFCSPGSVSGSTDPIESGTATLPSRQVVRLVEADVLRVEGVKIAQVGIEGETAAAALLTAGDLLKGETLTL